MAEVKRGADLDSKLIRVYNTKGLAVFLEVCNEMLRIYDSSDADKKKKVNGEVCEVVLDVLTREYMNRRRYTGTTFHSMVLCDRDNPKSSFRTELDFVFLTSKFCLTGECKSFAGDVVVTDDCTLTRGTLVAKVYDQSILHGRHLRKWLQDYFVPSDRIINPPFGLFCFVYSTGTLVDRRSKAKKAALPVLTLKTLYKYYDTVFDSYREEVYKYDKARKQFSSFTNSAALHRQHKDFLGY